ncbi:MAG: amidohydrolase family protein [Fimbriimonadaceae bacterium]|nr:amidohydrolase family protein [Fimbriimonadaceae bacterium]
MFRLLCGFFCLASLASAQSGGIAYINAHIEPIEGKAIERGTVAFQDGKIFYVGDGKAPNGFKTVDLKGAWVFPGFIDGAMTRGLKLPDTIQNEARDDATTVPTRLLPLNHKGVRPEILASACLDLAPALESQHSNGFTLAYMVPGAGTFRGQGAVVALAEGKDVVVVPSYGQGMAFTIGTGAGFPSTKFGVMALIRQTMLDAQRYGQFPPSQRSKELDPLSSLLPVLQDQQTMMWFVDSSADITRAMDMSSEFGARCAIIGGREAYRLANRLKEQSVPVIAGIAIGAEPEQPTADELPANYLAQRKAKWRAGAMNLVTLDRAGIPFALTSLGDTSANFWPNLRKVVELGLSRESAMRALTSNAAKLFGLGDCGAIAVGKRASLTVFTEDPFKKESKVTQIVINGTVVEVAK